MSLKNKSRIMLYKGRRKNALSGTGSAFSVIWQAMPARMRERKGVQRWLKIRIKIQ